MEVDAGKVDGLLVAARAGDGEALGGLFRAYQPALLRYLRARAPGHDEDLAGEVWVNVAQALGRYEGTAGDFPRWLFTIARRRVADHYRRRERRPEEVAEPVDETRQPQTDSLVDDLDWALRLVARLPAEQAEIVVLRVVADLSAEDVGEIVGKSPGAVRVASHRALCRLRELLADDHGRETVRNVAGTDGDGQSNG